MKIITRKSYFLIFLLLTIFLTSCARALVKPTPIVEYDVYMKEPLPVLRQDVFHVVGPGETLWRIAKMYDVTVDDVMRANHLKDSAELKMGQRLLIEGASPIKPVIPLYSSNKWKYIIIHHSATDEGSALSFDKYHRSRGWENLGYHFVIDNGSYGKQDGQIEVSPRWIKRQNGSHCKAGRMNCRAIGICLVGNFNTEKVSDKQMSSLVYLVAILKKHYDVPIRNIMGHGQVKGAKTECPGNNFPWDSFYSKLKEEAND